MKKKVLHITGAMNVGGTETMLVNLYRKINDRVTFDFISYSDVEAYYDKEIEHLGGKIIRLKPPKEIGFVSSINNLKKVIKENGPYDVVHTHMLFNSSIGMISAYLAGIKIRVSHAHTTQDYSKGIFRKFYIKFMRILIRMFSTNFLACSEKAGKYLFGNDISGKSNYEILPNYIDYNKFLKIKDKNYLKKELNINKDFSLICHIGRFIDLKNHDFLIDVFKDMLNINNKLKLILVGTGDNEEFIKNKVRKLNIEDSVYFLGIRNDIPNILSSVDLFVLPSIVEGLGLVLLEAQASSIHCLVSEAIQPEVDLGINLLYKLNLDNGSVAWAEKAIKILKSNKKNDLDVMTAFKERGYDLTSILNKLSKIYKINLY
ncbi:glycosyltransferase family 1 protein [Clostridium perfringens]|uniref:glycosyltransferase family 1 protein n=1 Tax=Clostridium perfringens TaxID=1502 RepID=UPI003F902A07